MLDDDDDLRAVLATVPGLDADAIVDRIDDPELVELYEADRARARSAEGSPTHVQDRHSTSDGPVRYTAPSVIFEQDGRSFEVGGFQPFEAYDTALANLDPTLTRRPAPADVVEALAEFPEGLTTAELASVMRPSDLVDADIEGTACRPGRARDRGPRGEGARRPRRHLARRRSGGRRKPPRPPRAAPAAGRPTAYGRAPAWPTARAASRQPAASASAVDAADARLQEAGRERVARPGAVLDASTATAAARSTSSPSVHSAPPGPSVTTTSPKRRASDRAAASGSLSPVSA